MKLKLKRVNPLTLDPGEKVLMGATHTGINNKIIQFPVKVYFVAEDGVEIPVEIENAFMESK